MRAAGPQASQGEWLAPPEVQLSAAWQNSAEWLAWAAIAAASLWLKTGFPSDAIANASLDDALFVKQARLLAAGHWLGPFDSTTLAKGMFFPLFIAAAYWLALPLPLAEQAAWLAASAVAARLVRRLSGSRLLPLVLFAALACDPVVWNFEFARVVREGIYLTESLLVVTLLAAVVFPARPSAWVALAWGSGLGLAAGAFWLTREEGPWLLPACAVTLLYGMPRLRRRERWLPVAVALSAAGAVFAASQVAVAALNWRHYGVFITNEFKSGPFQRAYGALARIDHDHWRRFVVLPRDARERAYSVSPAARELAAYLDGPPGEVWRGLGCAALRDSECPDILSGWFMWALRDAVAQAGHYGSGPDAMAFYDRLAREINGACDVGRIACGPPRATLLPVFRWHYLADTLGGVPFITGMTLKLADPMLVALPSSGPLAGIADFADVVGEVSRSPARAWYLQGWAGSPSGRPVLSLRVRGEAAASFDVAYAPGLDVEAGKPGWGVRRFELRAACPDAECELVATAPGGGEAVLPLADLRAGQTVTTDAAMLAIDGAELRDPAPLTLRRRAAQLAVAQAINGAYARAAPLLCGFGLAGLLSGAVTRRVPLALLAVGAAAAAALAGRVLLLAYLLVTSIPSGRILYTSPASPFVIVLVVVGCWCGARAVWPVVRARQSVIASGGSAVERESRDKTKS